jgi:hypothetical protein
LDRHALSLQTAQLSRARNYDDERFIITTRHPRNAPEWTYLTQSTPVDTDFSGPDTPNDKTGEVEVEVEVVAESSTSAMRVD